jgi:hypothetical protein
LESSELLQLSISSTPSLSHDHAARGRCLVGSECVNAVFDLVKAGTEIRGVRQSAERRTDDVSVEQPIANKTHDSAAHAAKSLNVMGASSRKFWLKATRKAAPVSTKA